MEFKITLKSQLNALRNFIIFSFFLLVAFLLLGNSEGFESDLFLIFGLFYGVNIVFVFIVHFQYYMINKNITLIIQKDKKQFNIIKGNYESTVNFSEIHSIEIFMMPSLYRKSNIQMLPFENYHYALIVTNDINYIITSLMVNNIFKIFEEYDIKLKRKICIYPYIPHSLKT